MKIKLNICFHNEALIAILERNTFFEIRIVILFHIVNNYLVGMLVTVNVRLLFMIFYCNAAATSSDAGFQKMVGTFYYISFRNA